MKAGSLRRRVTVQSLTVTQAADGAPVNSWGTFLANEPCSLVPLSGRELVAAAAQHPEVTAKAVVRYQAGYLPTMRLTTEDSETYVIRSVLPDPTAREYLTLMLEKGVTDE